MGVRRKIVRHQVAAHCNVLRDGLAVVAGHPRSKVLRRLDAAGRGFDRVSGNRYRRAGPSGVGIQQVLTDKDPLRRIRREYIGLVHVGCNRDVFDVRRKRAHADLDLGIAARTNRDGVRDLAKPSSINLDDELSG